MLRSPQTKQLNKDPAALTALPDSPKKKPVRRIKIKYGSLLCSILLLCLVVNVIGLHWEIVRLNQEISMRTEEKQELFTYQKELQEDMKMVQSGNYIEKLAREKLGMIKPGENPVITTSKDIKN